MNGMTRSSVLFVVACAVVLTWNLVQRRLDSPDAVRIALATFVFSAYCVLVAFYGRDDRGDTSIVARERRARRAARPDARPILPAWLQTVSGVVAAVTIAALLSAPLSGYAVAVAVGLVFGALAHRWVACVPHLFD